MTATPNQFRYSFVFEATLFESECRKGRKDENLVLRRHVKLGVIYSNRQHCISTSCYEICRFRKPTNLYSAIHVALQLLHEFLFFHT